MKKILSKDGTSIAFERSGQGPAIILVAGATTTRRDQATLAMTLAQYFTVFYYDRRGRGDSGDTLPYAVEREVEDIEALIDEAGGSAFVFGHSSGAVLALEAARLLPNKITKLTLYEPPFIVDDSRSPVPDDYAACLSELIASGLRRQALEYFMTVGVNMPLEVVARIQQSPMWSGLENLAHTVVYDAMIMGDTMRGSPLPIRKWASVTIPTLVIDGERSPAYMHHGTQELAHVLPNTQCCTLQGQDHGPADDVLVPVLKDFLI